MKIKEYKQMMSYLTRPGKPDDMETQVKRTTENNKNPGSFQRLVKEDEAENKKLMNAAIEKSSTPVKGYPKTDNAMEIRGQHTVAITDTANKHLRNEIKKGNLKKEDLLLEQDQNGLMVNKNRTIAMRDSFMAKQFNRALGVNDEPMATPEQVGKLAERLEKNAQMTGGKGLFTEIVDNLGKKPIIKKPIKKIPSKPYKFAEFKIDPILPHIYKPSKPDPEFLRQERNFQRMVEESNKPKGLPGILGLNKSDYE